MARRTKTKPLSIVILAAGQGKRMHSDLPKVLQPLAGRPLLQHVVDTARSLDPAALHVVFGHGGEQVRAAFSGRPIAGPNIEWTLQERQQGTGHAVQQAMPRIPDDHMVLVLYGDVPLLRADTLRELVALAADRKLALLSVKLANPEGYGRVVRDARGRVKAIVEHKDATRTQLRLSEGNTGVLAAPAGLLRKWLGRLRSNNAQGEFYLTDVIAMAVKDRVGVEAMAAVNESEVLGVNDRLQLSQLESALRLQRARTLMQAGATLADPSRFDQRGDLEVGRDVFIDVNVMFEGRVKLGDRVRIGPHCVLRDVTIGAGTEVRSHSVLDGAETGPDCVIGPFARLRPGTKLAAGAHVGNFVEVKNSSIGRGSKANHLTYLGDATVGANVNVGAGTITCNYDGVNKTRTVIEDGVFIGSGNMLVAPVTIGKDATTAAGSTITQDVPPGKLTVARSRQVTVEGWQRPVRQKR